MRKKIPPEAFEYYFALGAGRSYRAVAEHFGVSKTAVANAADREGWQKQVERRDEKVRANAEEKSVETREEMCERHLKMVIGQSTIALAKPITIHTHQCRACPPCLR